VATQRSRTCTRVCDCDFFSASGTLLVPSLTGPFFGVLVGHLCHVALGYPTCLKLRPYLSGIDQ